MNILVDRYIPFIKGLLEPYAYVEYLEPEEFTSDRVKTADALFVRTRTRCSQEILEGSHVEFIATATIGYDHIDTAYCQKHGIFWTNARGCNAQGVCDYVEAAIDYLEKKYEKKTTLGLVGFGHIGTRVRRMALRRGYRVLVSDPPLQRQLTDDNLLDYYRDVEFRPLAELALMSDIITFHTPLTKSGSYPTYHLCDRAFLNICKKDVTIINAARGGVVDEEALIPLLSNPDLDVHAIIDTWQGEPNINTRLLSLVDIGTYHIAGYTLQGKINATNMCLEAFCQHFSLPTISIPKEMLPPPAALPQDWLLNVDAVLRQSPEQFESLRETYRLR